MSGKSHPRLWVVVLGTAFVLKTCIPHPVHLADELRSPRAWVLDVGADAAAATLASALLWLIALWIGCGLMACAVALLPGRLGGLGRTVADRVTPAALRRVVVTAAGTSILLSPIAAAAAPAAGGPPRPHGASAVLPPVGWPTDSDRAIPPGSERATPARTQPLEFGHRVTVRPGDSLWSIAASHLGATPSAARIQAEWPRWYVLNRHVIGTDPNLLRPGTGLLVPEPARTAITP